MKTSLNLPAAILKFRTEGKIKKVFDPLRDKFVAFTPEENVRQHFTAWLRNYLHFPASLMANEITLDINGTRKRCDTIIFGRDGRPLVIVEYKAPEVPVSQNVFDQVVRYNLSLKAKYIIVSNGLQHYCCVIDYSKNTYHFIPKIPDFKEITVLSEN